MAKKTFKQLSSRLTQLPATLASGDTVENLTNGVMTLVIGVEQTVGKAKIIRAKEGADEIVVAPGATSPAITLAAGEKVYLLDTYDGGVSSTADKVVA